MKHFVMLGHNRGSILINEKQIYEIARTIFAFISYPFTYLMYTSESLGGSRPTSDTLILF